MRELLYTCGCIALFFSCKNEQSTTTITTPSPTKKEVITEAPKHYLHLKGTIKNLPITMDLNYYMSPESISSEVTKGYYAGSYYYDKYQEPIEILQAKDSAGVLTLTEKYSYDEDNRFVGKFDGNTFSGNWFDGYRKFSFPFELTIVEDDVIAFDYYSYSDTYLFDKTDEESPLAQFSLSALWPKDYKYPEATAFLKREIMKIIALDTTLQDAVTPEEYFNLAKANYFKVYQKDMQQYDYGVTNYGRDVDLAVVWNADDMLSIGAMNYENTSGAHGNYGTTYHVLDVKSLTVLTEKDLFNPNFERTIAAALLKSAERTFDSDMNDYKPIDAINRKELKPNGNFFVTGGGIGYNFVPYEIASYALGEIQLFLPKNEVMEVLQPKFIERMGW
ncbi:MAG: hypothetical protein ACI9XO_004449 [Paraglaciecola sp.]|jgi:hypothetical protein